MRFLPLRATEDFLMKSICTLLVCACFVVLPDLVAAQTQMRQQAKPSGWGARIVYFLSLQRTEVSTRSAIPGPHSSQLVA